MPEKGQIVTVIEAISPFGQLIPPLFISKGKVIPESYLPSPAFFQQKRSDFFISRSESAFSNSEIGLEWLQKIFIPKSTPRSSKDWRLLILDGHISHESQKFLELAYVNRVALLFLPPHATHILQPLDKVAFGVIKNEFHRLVLNKTQNRELRLGMQQFYELYFQARKKLDEAICAKSFEKAGIWPISLQTALDTYHSLHPRNSLSQPQKHSQQQQQQSHPPQHDLAREIEESLYSGGPEISMRSIRQLVHENQQLKAEKVMMDEEIQKLKAELATAYQSKRSRKILRVDPNEKVVNIRDHMHSQGIIMSDPPEEEQAVSVAQRLAEIEEDDDEE